eukprot:COSAG04_NODE_1409_length_6882_cov_4.508625_1_plen_82_part_00
MDLGLPLTAPPLPPPSAVRKRTEQPPPRSSSRCAEAAAPARPGFEKGAAVYLYHVQERRWQKGVISDRRAMEYGSGWPPSR